MAFSAEKKLCASHSDCDARGDIKSPKHNIVMCNFFLAAPTHPNPFKSPPFPSSMAAHRLLLQRVKKHLRSAELRKGETVSVESKFSAALLRKCLKALPLEIQTKGNGKKLAEATLDDEIYTFLESFLFKRYQPKKKAAFSLLAPLTDEEAVRLAHFFGFTFKPKQKNKKLKVFLERLGGEELKFRLHKSIKEVESL